jgi:excinuclease ABC subunit A
LRPERQSPSFEGGGPRLKEPIRIQGARTHNLRAIDCEIPAQALSVVTGVSGSGKSSLVFDTLYAEGQRRFVQSMSTYTRLFLERMERPDVDFISNIPPAIALAQKNTIRNARSTVGTITEINDSLRLLFSHLGTMRCLDCGGRVGRDNPDSATEEIAALEPGLTLLVTAMLPTEGLPLADVAAGLVRHGHRRILLGSEIVKLDGEGEDGASLAARLGGALAGDLEVVIDRLVTGKTARSRVREALDGAFGLGRGRVRIHIEPAPNGGGRIISLDRRFSCRDCGREYPEPTPNLFSFNSPLGACPGCEGFGRVVGIDFEKVIPNPRLALEHGAVAPWTTPANRELQEWMLRVAEAHGVRTDVAYADLDERERDFVINGEPRDAARKGRSRHRFPGVAGFFRWLEGKRYKTHVRILLARYRGYTRCAACNGQRLRGEALAVKLGDANIAELAERPIPEILAWANALAADRRAVERCGSAIGEVRRRLSYLMDVGLEYLTLARQARTLSGGEAQRIHLASALGAALSDTLYCLDEPTVGLHARDSRRLLGVLHKLTGAGNTVVVVEHDPVLIGGADHVIDLGPGGGALGGSVLYSGPPAGLDGSNTATGSSLAARASREPRPLAKRRAKGDVTIRGARENNLRDVTVAIPAARLTCVTGVSGSGKSTLVEQVLFNNYLRERGNGADAGACDAIQGLAAYDEVVLMTQAPVGRSARSNPATYLKAYDEIRALFAATPDARLQKIKPGHFSFNSVGGRCETCRGMGTVTIEMHFMADLTVACDECGGLRFKPRVLAVRYRGRSIDEVLAMTIDAAHDFFHDQPKVRGRLAALRAVGLGYLTLGQPTATLSGGEAQRLKLASFIDEAEDAKRRLLIFDEPTTGLHLSDIATLAQVLHGLVERGNTVLVVEHNLDFIATADWVIDLGPEGGDRGGQVVATATPEELAKQPTATGVALRELFAQRRSASAAVRRAGGNGRARPRTRRAAATSPAMARARTGSP